MTKAVGLNFYAQFIKDEVEENPSGKMDHQSPEHMPSMASGGMVSAQGSSASMQALPLNHIPQNNSNNNNNNANMSIQPLHRRMEIDAALEPQVRTRSNTWPADYPEAEEGAEGGVAPDMNKAPNPVAVEAAGPPKKNTSRRNPWGNLSYADLIAQAISSSPEHRATLSQVYEWMVNNIPYFKDKGDSNSSAGWKNSIRHNLSLHNRFMRIQNEGTGKSSWWVLNPEAKPGKSTRRRANTLEGGARCDKKRGRSKKKIDENLRSSHEYTNQTNLSRAHNPLNLQLPSMNMYDTKSLFNTLNQPDMFAVHPLPHFALMGGDPSRVRSPQSNFNQDTSRHIPSPYSGYPIMSSDYQPRASSNTSSCSRLSPILSQEFEGDTQGQLPISPALASWNAHHPDYWSQAQQQASQQAQSMPGQHHPHLLGQERFPDHIVENIGNNLGNSLNLSSNDTWPRLHQASAMAAAAAAVADSHGNAMTPADCLKGNGSPQIPPVQISPNVHYHQHHHLHNHLRVNGLMQQQHVQNHHHHHHQHQQAMQNYQHMYDESSQRFVAGLHPPGSGASGWNSLPSNHHTGHPNHHLLNNNLSHNGHGLPPHPQQQHQSVSMRGGYPHQTSSLEPHSQQNPYQMSSMQAMSPAHSSHSMSPTQSLGHTPDADLRTNPFPTPPNSLPQHHHSPSNCATPHSGQQQQQQTTLHGDYSMNAPNTSTAPTSQSVAALSSDSVALPSTSNSSNPTMLRSALTVGVDKRQLLHHHHHLHQHQHHHQGAAPQIPMPHMNTHGRHAGGVIDELSADCDDIDVNVMPIVSQEFPSELCEVVKRYELDPDINIPEHSQSQLYSPMSCHQPNEASNSPTATSAMDSGNSRLLDPTSHRLPWSSQGHMCHQ